MNEASDIELIEAAEADADRHVGTDSSEMRAMAVNAFYRGAYWVKKLVARAAVPAVQQEDDPPRVNVLLPDGDAREVDVVLVDWTAPGELEVFITVADQAPAVRPQDPVAYVWHDHVGAGTRCLRWTKPSQWDYTTRVDPLYLAPVPERAWYPDSPAGEAWPDGAAPTPPNTPPNTPPGDEQLEPFWCHEQSHDRARCESQCAECAEDDVHSDHPARHYDRACPACNACGVTLPRETEKELGACSLSRATIGDRTHDRRTEERDQRVGEEKPGGREARRCDATRTGGAESGARGGDAAQHEVKAEPGPSAPATAGVAPFEAPSKARCEFCDQDVLRGTQCWNVGQSLDCERATGVQEVREALTAMRAALQRIADMDPAGQRADDLGRAARLARDAIAGVKGLDRG